MASTRTPCVAPASASTRHRLLPILLCTLAFPLHAQTDTSVFKLLPNHRPDEHHDAPSTPVPEITHKPELPPPDDPTLHEVSALVWVKVLVDRDGRIRDARVVLSDDRRFDATALAYARKFRFRWKRGEEPEKPVWVTVPARFGE